jgi:hypothetical protein
MLCDSTGKKGRAMKHLSRNSRTTAKSLRWTVLASCLLLPLGLAACGDTWSGLKKDTGENLEKTGDAIEDAGKSIQ